MAPPMKMTETRALTGEKICLRPLGEHDLPTLQLWFNDPDVRHWLHQSERPEATLEDIRERILRPTEQNTIAWVIEADGRPIGVLRLLDIDPYHRRCELAISIGEKEYWGRGYGTDAIRQALGYGFAVLELGRVGLLTDSDNARGIRCYEKCGFVREGVLRQHRLRYGRPLDMVAMGVLRGEWEAGAR